jgi:hypothetical protein
MYVVTTLSGQESAATDGHAWIQLESNTGVAVTMSLWRNQGEQEFFWDKELKGGYGTASKSTSITYAQVELIVKYNSDPDNKNWTPFNTCAGYSCGLWNFVTGDTLSARTWYGTATPYQLQQSIINSGGKRTPQN